MTQGLLWDIHGTRMGYRSGCRCFPCRTYRYRCHREPDPLVDAQPARDHLLHLQELGAGTRLLASKARLSRTYLLKILRGQSSRIPARIEAAILAVKPTLAKKTCIDGQTTRQRLRALLTEGFTRDALSRELRLHLSWFSRDHQTVTADTAARIALFFRQRVEE